MDEKYIETLYNQLGGQAKFGAYDNFKNLLSTNDDYRKQFHSAFGDGTLGSYDKFESLTKKVDEPVSVGEPVGHAGIPASEIKKKDAAGFQNSSSSSSNPSVGAVATTAPAKPEPMALTYGSPNALNKTSVWDEDWFNPASATPAKYETKLNPVQEQAFQKWFDQQHSAGKIGDGDYNYYKQHGYGYDYDFRAAFLNGDSAAKNGHWSDIGKKPNHPTFSNESKYSGVDGNMGGAWDGDKFIPAQEQQTFDLTHKPFVTDATTLASNSANRSAADFHIAQTNRDVEKALQGDKDALGAVDQMNLKRNIQSNFSQKFYTGEITPDDVELIKSNKFYSPIEDTTPNEELAQKINNKTKNLRTYANAVAASGANKYISEWQGLDAQIKKDQSMLDANIGTNRFVRENGQWTSPIEQYRSVADDMNRTERRIADTKMKRDVLDAAFKKNVYDKREDEVMDKYIIPKIESDFFGTPIDEIYQRMGGITIPSSNGKPTPMDSAYAKGATVPDYLQWDESGQLTKKSQAYLDKMVDDYVNKINDPIISAYEHKQLLSPSVTAIPGTTTPILSNPQITAESLKNRLRNYMNYTVPAQVQVQDYTNKFLRTDEGKKIAPVLAQQTQLNDFFSSDTVRAQESGWKAVLDSGYVEINNKYDKILAGHDQYNQTVQKWQQKVADKQVTPEQATQQIQTELTSNPELSKILQQREREVASLRSRVNKEREKYIVSGIAGIDNHLVFNEDGTIGVKGVSKEELTATLQKYNSGLDGAFKDAMNSQQQQLEYAMNGRNLAVKKRFGGLLGSLLIGTQTGVNNLGASTSRWLYNKYGSAGDAVHYFDAEQDKPYTIGEYANEHFKYKGIESLFDPAYYAFNVGQSLPYSAPSTILALATGGAGGVVLGGVTGGSLEAAQNALNTRDELYLQGSRPNGVKISSLEADRAAADQFKNEWWVNSIYQAAEFGALLKTGLKPSIGKSLVDVGVSGLEEAVQEGHQGYIQESAKRRALGLPELGFFDYMQTDDFRQNFFGGLAGGLGQGGPTKIITHLQSIGAWQEMIKNAPQEFARNSFYANAMQQEVSGQGGPFRDGLRARLANDDFANPEEKELAGRTLKYSERLADAVKRENISPNNINGLYAAHNSAMADLYDELSNADEGKSSLSKTYKKQADAFRSRAVNALEGAEKIYVVNDSLGRPVFVSQSVATVMDESKAFDKLKEQGSIQGVYSIGDNKFNKEVSERIASIERRPVTTEPAAEPVSTSPSPRPKAIETGVSLIQGMSEEQRSKLGVYKDLAEQNPEALLKNIADQAIGRTDTGEIHPDGPKRAEAEQMFGKELVDTAVEAFPHEQVEGLMVGHKYIPIEEDDSIGPVLVTGVKDGFVNVVFDDKSQGKISTERFGDYYMADLEGKSNPTEQEKPAATQVNMSILSDRIPHYRELQNQFNEAVNKGDEATATKIREEVRSDLEHNIQQLVPGAQVQVNGALGVWDKGFEQSFKVVFDEFTPDAERAMVKIAQDFDQDAIHLIRSVSDADVTRQYGITDEQGNLFTQVVEVSLQENSLTLPEFQELLRTTGIDGGQLSEDGKTITIYNAYNGTNTTDTESARAATEQFTDRAADFVRGLESKGKSRVSISSAEFRSYGRDSSFGTRTYEQVGRNVPASESFQQRAARPVPDEGSNRAKRFLNKGQQFLIDTLSKIRNKKGERAAFQKKIAQDFQNMKMNNLSDPLVRRAYEALAKIVKLQFGQVPVRVYAWATPVQQQDGTIVWKTIPTEPYKSSKEMMQDVEQNNRMVFYTTDAGFGNGQTDYTGHPMLELTNFYSNPQAVVDEQGNPVYDNGRPKTARYQLNVNDALRVVHDYIAHATTGAQFGAIGEEKAWAAHAATILKEPGLTDEDKYMGLWALTSETRGQNSWVNFSGVNDEANKTLDEARKLQKAGDQAGYEKLKNSTSIQFSDQKADLLPAEDMLGGMKGVDEFVRKYSADHNIPVNENSIATAGLKNIDATEDEKKQKLSDTFRAMKFETKEGDVLYSNPVFILPKALWNTVMDIVANAIDAGVAIAQAIERGVQHAKENFAGKEFNETAVRMVLEGLAKQREEKPVLREGETKADYAMRVLEWRNRMIKEGTPHQIMEALVGSIDELDFIRKVNDGIELLRSNMDLSQEQFNNQLGVRKGDDTYYIAALKYFKSFSPFAEQKLRSLREANPTRVVATEIQLLKKQLKDFERGYKAGSQERIKAIKAIRNEIQTILDEYNERGYLSGVKYSKDELVQLASYVNGAMNEKSLNAFKTMMTRLITDADYVRKITRAKELQKQVRKILKSKDSFTANDTALLRQFGKLNPIRVSQLDQLNQILQDVVDSRTGENGSRIFTNRSLESYLENQRAFDLTETALNITQKLLDILDDRYVKAMIEHGKLTGLPDHGRLQNIVNSIKDPANPLSYEEKRNQLDDINATLDYVQSAAYNAIRTNMNKGEKFDQSTFDYNLIPDLNYTTLAQDALTEDPSKNGELRQSLEDMAKDNQSLIDTYITPSLTQEQKAAMETLKKVDLTGMESNQLRLFMNVLNNVLLNEDYSGMGFFEIKAASKQAVVDEFVKWLNDKGFTVRFKKERSKLGTKFSDLKKGFSSTEQVIWRIANNAREMATKIFEAIQMDKIKQGYVKAVHQLKSQVFDKLNAQFADGLKQDGPTNVRMTMYSYLNQNKGLSVDENQKEFARRVGEIKRDIAVKEIDTNEKNKKEAAIVKEVYADLRDKILAKTGVDIDLPVIEGLDNSVLQQIDFLSTQEKGAYDSLRKFYDDTRPEFQRVTEQLLNKEFEAWENYMPDNFRKLHGGVFDVDIGEGFGDSLFQAGQNPLSASSGAFNQRVKGPRVTQPKSGEDLRVINYNFFDGNIRNSRSMLMDIHTLKDRMVASDVMSNKEFENEVGSDNIALMKETMIKELKGMTGYYGKPSGKEIGLFKDAAATMGGIAAKMQLVSFFAYFKQAWSAYANTAAYLGSKWYYVPKALRLVESNKSVDALLDGQEVTLRGRTQAGTNIFGNKNISEVNDTIGGSDLSDRFKKLSDTVNGRNDLTGEEKSFMRHFLERGDVVGAKASWIAIYANHVIANGRYKSFDSIDWAAEAQNPDRDAAAFAQLQTSKQLNVNSRNAFGNVYQDPNSAMSILKSVFGLFGNFGFNKSISLINAVESLASSSEGISLEQRKQEKVEGVRTFMAGLSEEVMFQTVKVLMIKGGLGWLFWTIGSMLADKDDKDEFKKLAAKQMGDGVSNLPSSVISNYFFSFAGTNGQEYLNEKMNDLQDMTGVHLLKFYQNTENPNYRQSGGLFNAAFGNLPDDLQRLEELIFGVGAKRKEILWTSAAILSNLAQMAKVNDADLNRLVQRRVQMFDKDIHQRNGDPYWVDMSKMGTRELKYRNTTVELTEEQQAYYKMKREEKLEQLEKAKFSNNPDKDKREKSSRATDYAKNELRRKFPEIMKQRKEEKKK